jgi:hypothetical protein
MIGRTRLEIRNRQPRLILVLAGLMCGSAIAAPPPPPPPPPPTASADAPDEEFIEFLGEDDVGDAAWWEFLKKSALGAGDQSAPPPQEARQ